MAALAELLRELSTEEVEPAVGFLVGVPRQGRIGVGWRTVHGIDVEPATEPSLEVLELDALLSELATTSGSGSVGVRNARLSAWFRRSTHPEADFVRRLLTGELRQGALAGVMADAVATAAEVPIAAVRRAAMLSGDLGRAATLALTEGLVALEAVRLAVLHPIQPMLAASAADVTEALGLTGEASVEWKLDGARVQVHRDVEEVRIFTRNLNDITERLPGVVAVARSLSATSFVLDGDGLVVTLVGGLAVTRVRTADSVEAQIALDASLASGHEGVMVKAVDSTYDAGRRGGSWRKVKPAAISCRPNRRRDGRWADVSPHS